MKFLKDLKARLKSQKGISGVIVALLLVVIGVGLIAGLNTYLDGEKTKIQDAATEKIDTALGN